MAVVAIVVLVSGVVLINNGKFGGVVQLESLAYDIALSVRQAQVYGISVARVGDSTYSAGYGMHFDVSTTNGVNNRTQYILFADVDGDGVFTPNVDQIVGSPYAIQKGFFIAGLYPTVGGVESAQSSNTLDILYKRPEPDAWIAMDGVPCASVSGGCSTESVRIEVRSPRGDKMNIVVSNNGQISVRSGGAGH